MFSMRPHTLKARACFPVLFASLFLLSACDLAKNYTKTDRAANAEVQDFRDALAERLPEDDEKEKKVASIPQLQPYVSMTPAEMKTMPLVSISVNQSVPLRDILYELAEQANYDIELDPNIRGSIIFTARNKPFDVVVKRISSIAGLRYKFEDSFLRVELDRPYLKTYKIDYLSFIRTNEGSVNTSVSVVSEEGNGASAGSSYSSSSENTADFWGELEVNLAQILDGSNVASLRTRRDPRITAAQQNPDVVPVAPEQAGADGVQVQPPQAVLNVEALPVDDVNGEEDAVEASTTFSINRQAGMVTVYGSERVHKQVVKYLEELRRSVTAQVLVEAKIFEVSLFDEHSSGVQWNAFPGEFGFGFYDVSAPLTLQQRGTTVGGAIPAVSNTFLGYTGDDFSAFIDALSAFGTVRALASPRMTVLNNQAAILNVATNRVFFEIDVDFQAATLETPASTDVDADIRSVPEGVLINVQPSVNIQEQTISMLVRPTITRIVGSVPDPSVAFLSGVTGVDSQIPEVNIQEIDTVIKVNSGQPVVMGGLLQDKAETRQESIPVLGELPLVGKAFRSHSDSVSKTELIIFLKATIINNGNETVHTTDRDLYKMFSADRRPFDL